MPRRLPTFLRAGETERLLAIAAPRDRLILLLGLFLGLRVSEIASLRVENVNLEDGQVHVIRGKGDKDRTVPIPSKILPALSGWVGMRRAGYLFPSPRAAHLSSRQIERILVRLKQAGDIPRKCVPHSLRHTYATRLIQSGADIREVQELLGHSSISTTEVYLHVLPERLRPAVERL